MGDPDHDPDHDPIMTPTGDSSSARVFSENHGFASIGSGDAAVGSA